MAAATCAVAAATIAPAAQAGGQCNTCAELPALYRELAEQEALYAKTQQWIREDYYPASIDAMQGALRRVLGPGGDGGGGGEAGAPAFGTDMSSAKCQLVRYEAVPGKPGEYKSRPTTEAEVRKAYCKPIADYLLAHEGLHQRNCAQQWRQGKGPDLANSSLAATVQYFVRDDAAAYREGIGVLRRHIADLALRCRWEGSTNKTRADGLTTVPTPDWIDALSKSVQAKADLLKRGSQARSGR